MNTTIVIKSVPMAVALEGRRIARAYDHAPALDTSVERINYALPLVPKQHELRRLLDVSASMHRSSMY